MSDAHHPIKPICVDRLDDFKIAIFDKNIAYELNRINRFSLEEGIDFTIKGYPGTEPDLYPVRALARIQFHQGEHQ